MLNLCGIVAAILKMAKILHSDRSPLEEQFCIFKIFKMSAIFTMGAKTRHKIWADNVEFVRYYDSPLVNGDR
jgi:hypothetical protein